MNRTDDPHSEGYDACLAGLSEDANPYDPETEEIDYLSWNDGFNEALEEVDE